MEVKVFGPGCARCEDAANIVKTALADCGGGEVTKVSDLKDMMAAGVMATPAVMINGEIKCSGRVPTKDEVAAWLQGAAASPSPAKPGGGSCDCGGGCC